MNIEFVDKLSDATEQKMQKDLVKYESSHGVDVNYKPFSLVLTDDAGEVIGVINAFTAFSEIYIDDMWVEETHRRKGCGRMLLETLEDHFKDKGFNNINLVTNQFNAPGFYEKCGFELEFTRENRKHPQLTKYFFIKYFKGENQTQGILQNPLFQ